MSENALPLLTGQGHHPALYIFAASGDGFASPLFEALQVMMRGGQPLQAVPTPGTPQGGAQGSTEGKERREPLPRGEAERRALALLAEHPDEEYTPGRIAQEIDARGCRDLMARLHARGVVDLVREHPLTYRAARPPRQRRSRAKNKQ